MNGEVRKRTIFAWFPRRSPLTKHWFWLERVTLWQESYRKTVLCPEGLGPKDWTCEAWRTVEVQQA